MSLRPDLLKTGLRFRAGFGRWGFAQLALLLMGWLLLAFLAGNPHAWGQAGAPQPGTDEFTVPVSSAPVVTRHTRATLVADRSTIIAGQPFMAGLRLQLQPGWHSYWVNPGDAGDTTRLTLSRADHGLLKTGSLQWPLPQRLPESGLMAYAYTGDVLLPMQVTVPQIPQGVGGSSGPQVVKLKAHAEWLVCAALCVPEEGEFTLALPLRAAASTSKPPSSDAPSGAGQDLFRTTLAAVPPPLPAGVQARLFIAAPSSPEAQLRLGLSPQAPQEGTHRLAQVLQQTGDAWFLPLTPGVIDQDAPQKWQVTEETGHPVLSLQLHAERTRKPPFWQAPLQGVVVLREKGGKTGSAPLVAWRVTAAPVVSAPGAPVREEPRVTQTLQSGESTDVSSFLALIGSAFLGGLILNLMPCVFPVLAMKALALVRAGQQEAQGRSARRSRLESAGFYTLGIVFSFLALGLLLLGLKAAGAGSLGWGFQFQSPTFVLGLGWGFLLLALNLLGVFQITGGRAVRKLGNVSVSPKGQGGSRAGDFLTGCLAVVTATPCTAPFMGVAIAGALAAGPLGAVLLFGAMGLGLAAPYVLLALWPGLGRYLPAPGSWMETFRQLLAFLLLASAAWMVWVLSFQQGPAGVGLALTGGVVLGLGAWAWGKAQTLLWQGRKGLGLATLRFVALACLVLCLVGLVLAGRTAQSLQELSASSPLEGPSGEKGASASVTEPFSPGRLAELRKAGRPVLVDMSAAWCLTCLVNERVALDTRAVQQAFRQHRGVILRGDWTRRDPVITAWLQAHHRQGVPLYVFYPAHSPGVQTSGQILPQLLTPGLVLKVLKEKDSPKTDSLPNP
ncbi:cytochrome C biogenesis protein [Oecophyllibacter saccharovorans]|uniref:protein-disulfide reductase DsbD family protein n=1 Tax=Oecophyllibacter saccharovorans TaxID=2558360 RepID=UPI00114241D8|nr:thioredoxin family protein [Oecophyllibacter saccharovorans]QDH15082.1 cytochrome C biogenesis protein [Oecophyllibacter saccharovorans]